VDVVSCRKVDLVASFERSSIGFDARSYLRQIGQEGLPAKNVSLVGTHPRQHRMTYKGRQERFFRHYEIE